MFKDGQARPENLQFTVCFLVDYGASAFQKIFKNFLANDNELLTGECNNTISRELEEEKLRKIETEVKEKERIISNKDEEIDKYKETTTNLENRIRESEVDVNG
ncbi:unnamed protein product [Rhizophagus irregularis]|uniref:Uncharacterized protein n=1 Tax=Rhizophagus irregularis TaxID=588596 RepID=A0A915YXC8_9GLOM|nr:unnamed protein product [Rhizophagus irregularis]